jgi:hypothetical protein
MQHHQDGQQQTAQPHVFDQTNGMVDLGTYVPPVMEDPRIARRRESSQQAMAFIWGNGI